MSIETNWNEIDDHADKDLDDMLHKLKLSEMASNNPMVKIRRSLVKNMMCAVALCVVYVFIILFFHVVAAQICIAVVLLFTAWTLVTAWQQFKDIDIVVSSQNSLVEELKRQHQSIEDWMHTQLRIALFIYPVSAAGGFMIGGVLGSGKPVEVFLSKPITWISLIIITLLLVPAAHYLAKYLFKLSFGKHLITLQKNIQELEEKSDNLL